MAKCRWCGEDWSYRHECKNKTTGNKSASVTGLEGLQVSDEMLQKAMIEAVRQELFPKMVDLETYGKHWRGMKEVLVAALKAD